MDGNNLVCCSAPGKVLVTGGYLVLDRAFDGIVFTINSRFYTTIRALTTEERYSVTPQLSAPQLCSITLSSPQFESTQHYILDIDTCTLQPDSRRSTAAHKENKYVENTIIYTTIALTSLLPRQALLPVLSRGLFITIVGGNDFYSQIPQLKNRGLPLTHESLMSLPPFLPLTCSLNDLQKTGLGSSAALVASLTAALLSYFKAIDLRRQNDTERTMLHNLAQLCHCIAQGKIGSGFDISSAVFGSQVYRRFSPSLIQGILDMYDAKTLPTPEDLLECIGSKQQPWDNEHHAMALPHGLNLILADVSVGSNTPVMVKKVLEWRKSCPEKSKQIWDDIYKYNNLVKDSFNALHKIHAEDVTGYKSTLDKISQVSHDAWSSEDSQVAKEIYQVRSSFTEIRRLMREMGQCADVPLEPLEQTNLANETMQVTGCIASGVPGAGGFDALFAITIGDGASIAVRHAWSQWKACQVIPLVLTEDPTGVMLDTLPK
eukprot:gene14550-17196_t